MLGLRMFENAKGLNAHFLSTCSRVDSILKSEFLFLEISTLRRKEMKGVFWVLTRDGVEMVVLFCINTFSEVRASVCIFKVSQVRTLIVVGVMSGLLLCSHISKV